MLYLARLGFGIPSPQCLLIITTIMGRKQEKRTASPLQEKSSICTKKAALDEYSDKVGHAV
jgi:hypothetical protein